MTPYSMPLCTILTKWPAPLGRSADSPARPCRRPSRVPACAGCRRARRKRREDRIEMLDHLGLAADHHAVAALQAPDAAAGADVDVVDALGGEFLRAADVVDVVGVAAVDEDVAAFEKGSRLAMTAVHDGGRHHEPDRARLGQLLDEVLRATWCRRPSPSTSSATALRDLSYTTHS